MQRFQPVALDPASTAFSHITVIDRGATCLPGTTHPDRRLRQLALISHMGRIAAARDHAGHCRARGITAWRMRRTRSPGSSLASWKCGVWKSPEHGRRRPCSGSVIPARRPEPRLPGVMPCLRLLLVGNQRSRSHRPRLFGTTKPRARAPRAGSSPPPASTPG
jgi:hypothetical protein